MTAFRVLAADPPWHNDDQLPGKKRGASKHYPTMSTEQLCSLAHTAGVTSFRFPRLADDAILFLWRLSSMQRDALRIAECWDFVDKTEIVWCKYFPCVDCKGEGRGVDGLGGQQRPGHPKGVRWPREWTCELCDGTGCGLPAFGMGHYTRGAHESCLVATRGRMTKHIQSHSIRSVFHAPMPVDANGKPIHSAKPERFYSEVVEKLVGGPYVELFGRRRRPGWTVLGNQVQARRA